MEKITTKKELIERIEDVRAVEMTARKGYEEDLNTFKNFKITGTIARIKKDEDNHIKILDNLLEVLKQ